MYYDCTNFFFETEEESGIRKYGCSKENKPNPIVEMGLFIDGDGIPLAFSIHPGNTNEQTTLRPLEENILNNYGTKKFIVCTDAGLSSTDNRKFNNKANRAFVTVQSIKKMKSFQKKWALSNEGWRTTKVKTTLSLDDIEADYEKAIENNNKEKTSEIYETIYYKEEWFKENGIEQKYIVTFSLKYRDYLRKIRNNHIQRAEAAITNKTVDTKKQTDPKRLITTVNITSEGEVAKNKEYLIDKNTIDNEEQYDGFYCVATNLEGNPNQIIEINKQRWQINRRNV